MSDELLNQDLDVEGHATKHGANDDTTKDDEVEAHGSRVGNPRFGANDEPDDEVEGHAHRAG